MFKRVPGLLTMVALASTVAAPIAFQSRESGEWKRIRTANLVVVGNAGESELRRSAHNLEEFRRTLQRVFPAIKQTSPVPTVVVLLKNEAAFARFRPRDERGKPRSTLSGYFTAGPDVGYMVLYPGGNNRSETYDLLFHEYTHFVLRQNLRQVPSWLNEGIAEFYSTFESDYRDGKALLGRVVEHRLRTLRERPLLPLARMLTEEGSYNLIRDPGTVSMFYAQSWALVHYLELGENGKRQGQLTAYLRALERGRSQEDAFADAFATTFEGLQRELRAYVNRPTFSAVLIDRGTSELAAPAVELMSEADAHYVQGDLLVRVGAAKEADDELGMALREDAGHANARIARARAWLQLDRVDEAIALLREVPAASPSHYAAQLQLAGALRAAKRHDDALVASRAALKLDPRSASAWYGISLSSMALGRSQDAEQSLANTVALDPDPEWYRAHAYAAFRHGVHSLVVKDAAAYLKESGTESETAAYVAFLAAMSHRKLAQAAQAQQLLSQVKGAIMAGSWAEKVMSFLEGRLNESQFMPLAKTNGEQTEAHTYIGVLAAFAGNRAAAIEHLRWVKERGSRNFMEYPVAVAELERLENAAPAAKMP